MINRHLPNHGFPAPQHGLLAAWMVQRGNSQQLPELFVQEPQGLVWSLRSPLPRSVHVPRNIGKRGGNQCSIRRFILNHPTLATIAARPPSCTNQAGHVWPIPPCHPWTTRNPSAVPNGLGAGWHDPGLGHLHHGLHFLSQGNGAGWWGGFLQPWGIAHPWGKRSLG